LPGVDVKACKLNALAHAFASMAQFGLVPLLGQLVDGRPIERRRYAVSLDWWAHWDLNPEPKDYAYHFDFCRRTSGVKSVRGLDHAFTMPLPV